VPLGPLAVTAAAPGPLARHGRCSTAPMTALPRRSVALLDIDGTLLDSNDAHARAWVETLRRARRPVEFARIRPLMGQGGDKVLAELFGLDADEPLAKRLSTERRRFFLERCLPALAPTPGARALLERMKRDGLALVVATSAGGDELQALLRQAGVADLVDASASASDAEHSKPDPDIVVAALASCGARPEQALMLGDTPYDIAAAAAAGVDTVALRCGGGWDDAALADAVAIYDDPAALLADWDRSPFVAARQRALSRAR
jgi:HAD superfamily hydrolase (TIGR01509 family)